MKKILLIFLLSLSLVIFSFGVANAQAGGGGNAGGGGGALCDDSTGGANGLVPCGRITTDVVQGTNVSVIMCNCRFEHIGLLIRNVFDFILWKISVPLAGIVVVLGGILLIISGGNPALANQAKNMIKWAIIAVILIFTSWLIINTILVAIGVQSQFRP